jgi:hypothetical protein
MDDLLVGARGSAVRQLQTDLGKVGHAVAVDGALGPETLGAVQAYAHARTRKGAPGWLVAAIHEEATQHANELSSLRHVGAWCGATSLASPTRDVDFAAKLGLTRLDVFVNDHSKARAARKFTTYDVAKIEKLCKLAKAKGISVHLTSWIMPHSEYIDAAAATLVPLCAQVGAESLQWDAEEPWTQATGAPSRASAAARIAERFDGLSCPMGATGIGYTPIPKFGPLAQICDYVVPQAYATSTSGLLPEDAPGKFHRRYSTSFARPIVIGLAAYRQNGIAGHTPSSAVRAALLASAKLKGVDTVLFWSLGALQKSAELSTVIQGVCTR